MEYTLTMNDELYTHRFDVGGPPPEVTRDRAPCRTGSC